MKTSWVLTEDDKTKLGARHGDRDQDHETLNIKTEQEDTSVNVKQRSPSPMSFRSGPGGNYYFPHGCFSHPFTG